MNSKVYKNDPSHEIINVDLQGQKSSRSPLGSRNADKFAAKTGAHELTR